MERTSEGVARASTTRRDAGRKGGVARRKAGDGVMFRAPRSGSLPRKRNRRARRKQVSGDAMTNRRPAARYGIPISRIEAADDKDYCCGRAMLPVRITGFFRAPARRAPLKGGISNFGVRRKTKKKKKKKKKKTGETIGVSTTRGSVFLFGTLGLARRRKIGARDGYRWRGRGALLKYRDINMTKNDGQLQRLSRDENAIGE